MNLLIFFLLSFPEIVRALASPSTLPTDMRNLFRIRTITAFVCLTSDDFDDDEKSSACLLEEKIRRSSEFLSTVQEKLQSSGYTIQTLRIATNPFGEYLINNGSSEMLDQRLKKIDTILAKYGIDFFSLGPAKSVDEIRDCCPRIISSSPRLSCSANVDADDVQAAKAAAECILQISTASVPEFLQGGLGNFRFCSATCCPGTIPFFPSAYSSQQEDSFAIGLENGAMAHALLSKSSSISNIADTFYEGMAPALLPIQQICEEEGRKGSFSFLGIDTSLNPSLDKGGSVADAIETLEEVRGDFGGPGTLAAAAAITKAIQSLPSIKTTGYCGLMLPVCEDRRLAELTDMRVTNFLAISSVCGVGVDTVPISASTDRESLQALLLDVAALASRWNKPLSCRVFPVGNAGEMTNFDSPYLCNSRIYSL